MPRLAAMTVTRAQLAKMIDHTLLKTDATPAQVSDLVAEARELGTWSVCVSPSMLPLSDDLGEVKVATVVGFPSGKHHAQIKADEAARAIADGADEIDMVIDISLLKDGHPERVADEIAAVRAVVPAPKLLKVIIESAALSDDEIIAAARACEQAGADFVKTSTGFHPAGGASVHAVELIRSVVGDRLGIKASGGIRDWDTAQAMVDAGATRLGLSSSREVLDGGTADSDY